jgi:DNA-binding LytR/AlgR family response regulator
VRALIVDDEPLARRGVALRLEKCSDVEIVGECGDGSSAVEKIFELSPDVVFLDVQMPGMDGFEVLRTLPKENLPGVIFLTAYEQHALRAFEVHALDYLLKPVDDERFAAAVNRARGLWIRLRGPRSLNVFCECSTATPRSMFHASQCGPVHGFRSCWRRMWNGSGLPEIMRSCILATALTCCEKP